MSASVCRRNCRPLRKRSIKAADRAAAYLEATRLAGFAEAEARRFFGKPPKLSPALERDYLTPWPAETAEARYLERFAKLCGLTLFHHRASDYILCRIRTRADDPRLLPRPPA